MQVYKASWVLFTVTLTLSFLLHPPPPPHPYPSLFTLALQCSLWVSFPLLLWFGCEMSPQSSCIGASGVPLVMVFGEVVVTLGGGSLPEKVGLWGLGLEAYSLVPLPVPSLLCSHLPRCEQSTHHHSCKPLLQPSLPYYDGLYLLSDTVLSPTYFLLSRHFVSAKRTVSHDDRLQQTGKILNGMRLSS